METDKKRNIQLKNQIGIYDGYIPHNECDKVIKYYEEESALNKSFDRLQTENAPITIKNDKAVYLNGGNITAWQDDFKTLLVNFDIALRHYQDTTGALQAYGINEFKYTSLKIQKTLPSQGYHVWHLEHGIGKDNAHRALVFTIYLNDVAEGGETEFLHQSVRAKPVKGRCVIWPAGFPYVHRGNPPLQGEKYIITSWMMLPY